LFYFFSQIFVHVFGISASLTLGLVLYEFLHGVNGEFYKVLLFREAYRIEYSLAFVRCQENTDNTWILSLEYYAAQIDQVDGLVPEHRVIPQIGEHFSIVSGKSQDDRQQRSALPQESVLVFL